MLQLVKLGLWKKRKQLKNFLSRLLEPLLLSFDKSLSWRFCLAISVESAVIFCGLLYVSQVSAPAWVSLFGYIVLSLSIPLILLQVLRRLVPNWTGSIEFKYLSIFAALAVWFSSALGRHEVSSTFFVSSSEFPAALTLATFFNVGQWLSVLVAISCLLLEVLALAALAKPRQGNRTYPS